MNLRSVGLPVDSRPAQPETGLVVADDVVIRFGDIDAAGPISFSVTNGEFISLLGPSGCGKSSLLRAISGLIPTASGRLSIAGQPPGEAAAMRVGLMFQKPLLLPWRTTLQNIVLPAEIATGSSGAIDRSERSQALELLRMVGLSELAGAYPHQLSGGMQQRAALARTLISDPDILLLDEPYGALDEFAGEAHNEKLLSIWMSGATRLKAVIMVTHSIPEAVAMSDRILVLSARPARLLEVVAVRLSQPRDPADAEFARILGITRTAARPS